MDLFKLILGVLASLLRSRAKLEAEILILRQQINVLRRRADLIAAGNIGCMTQLAAGTAIPVVHPVELIDWATGGPVPDGLQGRVATGA